MKKNLLVLLLVGSMVCESAFAGCSQPVFYLRENQPSPCAGYLFSPEKEKQLRLLNEDYKILKQEVELKDKSIISLQSQVKLLEDVVSKEQQKSELWRSKAEDSTKKFIESEKDRENRDLFWLLTGVILTVAAGYAVGAASK